MARRYSYNSYDPQKAFALLFIFLVIYIGTLWKTDRTSFWLWVLFGVIGICAIGVVYLGWSEIRASRGRKKADDIFSSIRETGSEEIIYNFINSFGYQ